MTILLEDLDETAWQARFRRALMRLGGDATPNALRTRTLAWRGWSTAQRALDALVATGELGLADKGQADGAWRVASWSWRTAHYYLRAYGPGLHCCCAVCRGERRAA